MIDPPIHLLLLDVGNTIAFLDVGAVAEIARAEGHAVSADVLARAEGRAKRRYEALMAQGLPHEEGWGLYLATLLEEGGLPPEAARAMIGPLRRAHDAFNLWRRVPDALPSALHRIRRAGVRVAIVSNSEGRLPELLARVGIAEHFEAIVDSHHEGVRKPDPEIFRRALARLGVDADHAIYLGDIPGVDVAGANAAGIRAVLVDPFGFYPEHPGPRTPSVAAWIDRYLGGGPDGAAEPDPGNGDKKRAARELGGGEACASRLPVLASQAHANPPRREFTAQIPKDRPSISKLKLQM